MKKFSYSVLGLLFLTIIVGSCAKKELPNEIYFTENITIYPSDTFTPDTIEGQKIIDEVMGTYEFVEGYGLVAANCPKKEKLISIYTLGGDSVGEYCLKGQGPDDVLNADVMTFALAENGDTCLWLNDVSMKTLKRLNISLSQREGTTKIDSMIPTEFGAINACIAGDFLVYEIMDNDAYKLRYRDLSNPSDTLHTEQLYVYPTEDFYAYYGRYGVSPDNRYLAIAMAYFNQLNIIDLNDMSRRAVSLGNLKNYADSYSSNDRSEKFWAYQGVACGDDRIYAIYTGIDATDDAPQRTSTTIHAINYDGTIDRVYVLNDVLRSIAYDNSSKSLLGVDDDDNIIKYQLE